MSALLGAGIAKAQDAGTGEESHWSEWEKDGVTADEACAAGDADDWMMMELYFGVDCEEYETPPAAYESAPPGPVPSDDVQPQEETYVPYVPDYLDDYDFCDMMTSMAAKAGNARYLEISEDALVDEIFDAYSEDETMITIFVFVARFVYNEVEAPLDSDFARRASNATGGICRMYEWGYEDFPVSLLEEL